MWIPGINVGDGKWLLCTKENRKIFNKFVESAILCEGYVEMDGSTSIIFSENEREKNSARVQQYVKWFGVHTDLKRQYDLTNKNMEAASKIAVAGIRGVVRGGKDGGEISH